MAAGSIVVDLLMRTGSFITDTDRAAKQLRRFKKDVADTATSIKGQLVGALAAVGVSVSFDALIQGAAAFKDLEEETGAAAEEIASLSIATGTAGVQIESFAGSINKLTKNLSGVDDESKAAGAALAALGIPIEEFKRLDPVAQIDALTKAFNGFADGPQKSAVALALFGKTGAENLKVFKALEEQGGRTATLTREQIELADAYADRQAKLVAQLKAYAQASAVDVLPALNDLTGAFADLFAEMAGIDRQGKKLAGDSAIAEFATNAADALAFIIDAGQGVTRVFQVIGTALGSGGAQVAAVLEGEFRQAGEIARQTREDIDKILGADLFSDRLARRRADRRAADPANIDPRFLDTRGGPGKPQLEFDGAVTKPKRDAERTSEAQRYLETLQKQVETTLDLTTYEQALFDIQQGRLKGITPALEAAILKQAEFNDLNKQAIAARDAEVAVNTARARAQLDQVEALEKGNASLREEIALIGLDEIGQVGVERARVSSTRALREEERARRSAAGATDETLQALDAEIAALREREALLSQKIDRSIEQRSAEAAKRTGDSARDALADSIEQGILEGFRAGNSLADVFLNELKAQFARTVLRPLIQPVADAGNSLLQDILGAAAGAIFGTGSNPAGDSQSQTGEQIRGRRAGGGDVHAGGDYLVGEQGPELFRPSTSGRILPNSALGGGGMKVIVNAPPGTTVTRQQQVDERTMEVWLEMAEQRVAAGIASGSGLGAQALKSRGVRLDGALPRR